MSELERLAIPIIRSLESSWPLSRAARATVAEFLGLQIVRGPAWRSKLDEFVETGLAVQASLDAGVAEEVAHRASEEMRVPERRNRLFSPHTAIAATMFVNMHWTLRVAAKPCLFTSDHPVVLVPLGANGRGKAEPLPSTGLVNTMEFRFAATPTTLLLGCWLDEVDGLEPGRLARHQAQSHNALVAEQAEQQWFRHPDGPAVPPRRGVWRSIAGERHRSYTVHAASRSLRRAGVRDEVEAVTAARMRSPRIKQISWIGPGAASPPRAESGPSYREDVSH
jgi:hypothetical protein